MNSYSKFVVACNGIVPLLTMNAAAVAMFVAVNSTRNRRREGGHATRLPLGGLGSKHPNKKRPTARYVLEIGKAAWKLQPKRTKFFLDYIENAESCRDPTSVLGKEFKHKFRISYAMFEEILKDTRESELFADEKNPKRGPSPHPLAMKVLAALRRLALGIPVDGLVDMSGVSYAVLRKFVTKWEDWFVTKYFDDNVKIPEGDGMDTTSGFTIREERNSRLCVENGRRSCKI